MQFKLANKIADNIQVSMAAAGHSHTMTRGTIIHSRKNFLSVFLLTILLATAWAQHAVAQSGAAYGLPDFQTLIAKESKAVVKVSVTTNSQAMHAQMPELDQIPESLRKFFEGMPEQGRPDSRPGQGFGSGFIISEDGYIITNAHVVDNATDIVVGLQDRREFDAELVGADKATDVAVLKVKTDTDLPVVQLGNSDDVKVGQWVLAIGSPFGFEYSATQGIVSAVARNLPADTYVPFIQTDVAVNPGNSGGPLFNTDGEVIGVNSQIYSRSGGYQGLSFAIPINVAANIAQQIRAKGYASRGWLGVVIQDVNQALAESFGLDRPTGALIADVSKDSPAESSGLQSGDIILEFNGREVTSSGRLPPLVGAVMAGTTVDVMVLRDGQNKTLPVTIGELESDEGKKVTRLAERDQDESPVGVVVGSLSASELSKLALDHGVVVTSVSAGSPAAEAGLQSGDVIMSLNRLDITSVDEFHAAVKSLPGGKPVPVLVQRGGSALFRVIELPAS